MFLCRWKRSPERKSSEKWLDMVILLSLTCIPICVYAIVPGKSTRSTSKIGTSACTSMPDVHISDSVNYFQTV